MFHSILSSDGSAHGHEAATFTDHNLPFRGSIVEAFKEIPVLGYLLRMEFWISSAYVVEIGIRKMVPLQRTERLDGDPCGLHAFYVLSIVETVGIIIGYRSRHGVVMFSIQPSCIICAVIGSFNDVHEHIRIEIIGQCPQADDGFLGALIHCRKAKVS